MQRFSLFYLLLLFLTGECGASTLAIYIVPVESAPEEVELLLHRGTKLQSIDIKQAIVVLQEALRIHRELAGADSPDTIVTLERLAMAQSRAREEASALSNWQLIHQLAVRSYGVDDYRSVAAAHAIQDSHRRSSLNDSQRAIVAEAEKCLIEGFDEQDPLTAAERLETGLGRLRETLGPASREARGTRLLLCAILAKTGRSARGVEVLIRDLDEMQRCFGSKHPFTAQEEGLLGGFYGLQEQHQKSIDHLRLALQVDERSNAMKLTAFKKYRTLLVLSLLGNGEREAAEQEALTVLESSLDANGNPGKGYLAAANLLATAITHGGQDKDRAAQVLTEALLKTRGHENSPVVELNTAQITLAVHCVERQDWRNAVLHAEAVCGRSTADDPTLRGQKLHATELLGTAYLQQARLDEAIPLLKSTYITYRNLLGSHDERTKLASAQLVTALQQAKRADDMEALLSEPRPFPAP